jgi:hypothetical protein
MIEIKVELDRSECLTQQIIKKIEQENLSRAILKISYKLPPGKRDTVDIKLIQAAAKRSWIIASINPIHQVISRASRIDKAAQMNTEELLVKYIQLKQENPKQQEKLILEAKKIIAEAQNMIKEN